MSDFFTLGTTATYIAADTDNMKKIWNRSGGDVGRNTTSAVVSTDNAIVAGASYTASAGFWYISASTSGIMVEPLGASVSASDITAYDDLTVTDDLTVSDTLTVTGTSTFTGAQTLTGATTLTGGAAGGIPRNVGTWSNPTATSGTDTACSNGTVYTGSVFLPMNATITGIQYLIGSVGGTDKVVAALYNKTGTLLANSATAGATVGTAAQSQQVAFTSTYAAVGPAYYHIGLCFNGTTAKFRSVPAYCDMGSGVVGNGVAQTFGTPATITAPTTFTADKVPIASLY